MNMHQGIYRSIFRMSLLSSRMGLNRNKTYSYLMRYFLPSPSIALSSLKQKQPFVITGSGRSGTMLFSHILNSIQGNYVVHEPVPGELDALVETAANPAKGFLYINHFRLQEMAFRIKGKSCKRYGEVNGYLRRHVRILKVCAPFFKVGHLIRDGRNVVTSGLNRKNITQKNMIDSSYQAIDNEHWNKMSKFQQKCWIWANDQNMSKYSDFSVRFEDLITDYDYFKQRLLVPLHLNLSSDKWSKFILRPVNATKGIKRFLYKDWSNEEKKYFWDVCGEAMKRFGYSS